MATIKTYQAVSLVSGERNYYLCIMELIEIMQSFLPRLIVEHFEIVKIED